MAINSVELDTTFAAWRLIINDIISALGDPDSLSTTSNVVVGAINEVLQAVGDITSLSTADKTNLVVALNEVLGLIGDISSLDTDDKTNIVSSINEIHGQVGDLASLSTTDKNSIVSALNEVLGAIGDIATLSTTNQSNVVAAINELDGEIGDLGALATTDQSNIVAAINETQSDIGTGDAAIVAYVDNQVGDPNNLTTTDKTNVVAAVNELDSEVETKVSSDNVYVENKELNQGRFTSDTGRNASVFDGVTKCIVESNASVFAQGEKFIDDNADNGGAGGSLGSDASDLVTALGVAGRTDLRNGYEFYILDVTAGASTTDGQNVSSIDYYPICETDDSFLGPIGSTITYQFWCRLETLSTPANNGIILGDTNVTTYINGIESNQHLLTVGDGWVHVRQTATLTNEFKKYFPSIYANSGDVVNIALACLYQANVDNGIHLGVM